MNNFVYEEIKGLSPVPIAVKSRKDGAYLILYNDKLDFLFLNEIASEIFGMFDGKRTIAEIVEQIFQIYEVDKENLIIDICHLVRDLQWKGVIRFRKYLKLEAIDWKIQ